MTLFRLYALTAATLLLQILFYTLSEAQEEREQCWNKFMQGKTDFVLDADASVTNGATFLTSLKVSQATDCVSACCKDPNCNLALVENQEGAEQPCFLFNCLYKQKKVCQFVRKKGFSNYVLNSVFGSYPTDNTPREEDQPPIAIAGQDRVVQPNEVVILNGIESRDDHKIVAYKWTMASGKPTAVMENTKFEDEVAVSNLSAGVYKFKLTVTDNTGQTGSVVITVLVLTPEQSLHHCLVPKKVGVCRGSYPRWHYNAASEKCEKFIYGGCKGNSNNYLTEKECQDACVSVSNPSGRHGRIEIPAIQQCGETCGPDKFTCANGCCIDKALECDQERQCSDGSDESNCDYLSSKFKILINIPVDVDKAHCTQLPVTGNCRASFTLWYYNPYERKCRRFNYGGCDGNDNRFETEEICFSVCKGVTETDAYNRRGEFEKLTEDQSMASVGIAVVLGLAILILLGLIGYCFLKGRKQKQPTHQRVAANGAYVHPIEDTEKLVYNSTTKPM